MDDTGTCLLVLIGLPASGKSSLANSLQETCEHCVVIDFDAVESSLSVDGSFSVDVWKESRRIALNKTVDIIEKNAAKLVVIDDNMYYRGMRRVFYQIAREHHIGYAQFYLECDRSVCLQRNRTRQHPVPDFVITSMAEKLQPPDPETHKWEKHSAIISVDGEIPLNVIRAAANDPAIDLPSQAEIAVQKQHDREISAENMLHQADIRLKKAVSELLSEISGENKAKAALQLRELKRCIWDRLGTYPTPDEIQYAENELRAWELT